MKINDKYTKQLIELTDEDILNLDNIYNHLMGKKLRDVSEHKDSIRVDILSITNIIKQYTDKIICKSCDLFDPRDVGNTNKYFQNCLTYCNGKCKLLNEE